MVDDVDELPLVPINGVRPLVAARLYNFPTGSADLQPSHFGWLQRTLIPAIESANGPWLDVCGYASRLGSPRYPNLALSERRENAVKYYVAGHAPQCAFNPSTAYGSSQSTGGPTDDHGHWRAVDVHVFGDRPPQAVRDRRPPRPPDVAPLPWIVTNLSSSFALSYFQRVGASLFSGTITFAHSREAHALSITRGIHFAGIGVGREAGRREEGDLNVFGGMANRLTSRLGMALAVVPALAVARFESLVSSVIGNAATNISSHVSLINNASVTAGCCYPIHRPFLTAADFSGGCAIIALSSDLWVGSFGHYAIFFGLPPSFYLREIPIALAEAGPAASLALTRAILRECRGFAYVASGGVSPVLTAGVSATGNIGWID
jgi:hypothetical protein